MTPAQIDALAAKPKQAASSGKYKLIKPLRILIRPPTAGRGWDDQLGRRCQVDAYLPKSI
jgi:hypothetical protein